MNKAPVCPQKGKPVPILIDKGKYTKFKMICTESIIIHPADFCP